MWAHTRACRALQGVLRGGRQGTGLRFRPQVLDVVAPAQRDGDQLVDDERVPSTDVEPVGGGHAHLAVVTRVTHAERVARSAQAFDRHVRVGRPWGEQPIRSADVAAGRRGDRGCAGRRHQYRRHRHERLYGGRLGGRWGAGRHRGMRAAQRDERGQRRRRRGERPSGVACRRPACRAAPTPDPSMCDG